MAKYRLLIVDDSIMDRMILRNMLETSFDVIEAQNGYGALEIINNSADKIDGMLLDISMPVLDGFGVLNMLDRSIIARMPILLISAEARKDTIMRAAQYGVTGFIKKPFNATMILAKLKSVFEAREAVAAGNVPVQQKQTNVITESEIQATNQYVEKLKKVYLTYLAQEGLTDDFYIHVSEIMHILLTEYYVSRNPRDLSPAGIDIIAQAAYFYDIGKIVIRNEKQLKKFSVGEVDKVPETHTIAGADLISINNSTKVAYFVKIAADMCMHHHERCDGQGFPHGLRSSINNIYTQMLSMTIDFATKLFESPRQDTKSICAASSAIYEDRDAYRPECIETMQQCQDQIIDFYAKNPVKK